MIRMEKDLSFDLDKDGVADVVVQDTNGHTIYVNVGTILKYIGAIGTTILSVVLGYTYL